MTLRLGTGHPLSRFTFFSRRPAPYLRLGRCNFTRQGSRQAATEKLRPPPKYETTLASNAAFEYRNLPAILADTPNFSEEYPTKFLEETRAEIKRTSNLANQEIFKLYPPELSNAEEATRTLRLDSEFNRAVGMLYHYMTDVPLNVLQHHILAPVRHLINGRGKGWRSHLFVLSLEAFGVDPEPLRPLMAGLELIHAGSIIVDDIQDGSPSRRGVSAVHTMWGTPTAINAGTAAYFAFYTALQSIRDLSPAKRLGLLEIYFEMMRLGHLGQALDIAGPPQGLLDDILSGRASPSTLEESIISVHRLKTAVFASHIARMSALLADASIIQTHALASHWERVGIAFQTLDDVHDLRRVVPNLANHEDRLIKTKQAFARRGEDIRSGKINVPIAKAGRIMPLHDARWVWDTVLSKPGDDDVTTQKVIDRLESYDIVDRCISEARKAVQDSWQELDEHLLESQAKADLYALSRYMTLCHPV